MLCLNKKTDYALTALAFMAERGDRVSSAREMADAHNLPLPLLMKILKCLQHHGILSSVRGARGGYRIAANLEATSLFDLVAVMECPDRGDECGCMDPAADPLSRVKRVRSEPAHAPVAALQYKLVRFLKDVKLSDLIMPGRRIDVPAERLTAAWLGQSRRYDYGHSVV